MGALPFPVWALFSTTLPFLYLTQERLQDGRLGREAWGSLCPAGGCPTPHSMPSGSLVSAPELLWEGNVGLRAEVWALEDTWAPTPAPSPAACPWDCRFTPLSPSPAPR